MTRARAGRCPEIPPRPHHAAADRSTAERRLVEPTLGKALTAPPQRFTFPATRHPSIRMSARGRMRLRTPRGRTSPSWRRGVWPTTDAGRRVSLCFGRAVARLLLANGWSRVRAVGRCGCPRVRAPRSPGCRSMSRQGWARRRIARRHSSFARVASVRRRGVVTRAPPHKRASKGRRRRRRSSRGKID
jgi:hypothetical protein